MTSSSVLLGPDFDELAHRVPEVAVVRTKGACNNAALTWITTRATPLVPPNRVHASCGIRACALLTVAITPLLHAASAAGISPGLWVGLRSSSRSHDRAAGRRLWQIRERRTKPFSKRAQLDGAWSRPSAVQSGSPGPAATSADIVPDSDGFPGNSREFTRQLQ